MKFDHSTENNICVVNIDGNIALDGTNEVKEYVKPFMEDADLQGIILDFSKVNFIDSSGIGLIVSIFKMLQVKQTKLVLAALNKKNREIFNMTRLDKILTICDTLEDAKSVIAG